MENAETTYPLVESIATGDGSDPASSEYSRFLMWISIATPVAESSGTCSKRITVSKNRILTLHSTEKRNFFFQIDVRFLMTLI